MDMTLQDLMTSTSEGAKIHVFDMSVSGAGTNTYMYIFHGDVEVIDGFTYYKWIQPVYVVVDTQSGTVLETQHGDSNEFEQLLQGSALVQR